MSTKPPSYRLHKSTGQAVVRIDGKDYYLGKHGTEVSKQAYRRIIAEWATSGPHIQPERSPDCTGGLDLTLDELILAFWDRHVTTYYVKNGKPTSEQDNIRQALRFLRRTHGSTPARQFGPLALKNIRQAMIEAGRCRKLINKDVNRTRGVFRWAVENELLPVTVHQALKTVSGLRQGRTGARETPPGQARAGRCGC